MDQYELHMVRLKDLQSELMPYPEWAKAEELDHCYSLKEIWDICHSSKKDKRKKVFPCELIGKFLTHEDI